MALEFETPWFVVRHEGRYVIDEKNGTTGAAALVCDIDGRFALVEIDRVAIGRLSLEAPRGFAEDGETPAMAACREFLEETGQAITPEQLDPVGEVAPNTGLTSTRVQLFCGRSDRRFSDAPRDQEAARVVFLSGPDMHDAARRGDIVCGVTLALIAKHLLR